jgi:predicted nucleotidyltransferase
MTHEERLQIARELARKVLDKHGGKVTAIALYGSTAKGEDLAHSDLDLWVATSEPVEDVRFFSYRGLPISINWDTEAGRLKLAGSVSPAWPLDADELRSYIVLYERGDFIERLKQAAGNVRDEDFSRAMQALMPRVHETANKVRSAWERGDRYGVLSEGRALCLRTAVMLGLLNRRYYPGGRGIYRLSKQLEKQPKDYPRLLDIAGGFTTVEVQQVYSACIELWDNLARLVGEAGVQWELDELGL